MKRAGRAPTSALLLTVPLFVAGGVACDRPASDGEAPGPAAIDPQAHREEVLAWREERLERLRSDEGWLSLVGLVWIEEGVSTVGSDPGSTVVLPAGKAPARLATLELASGVVSVEAAPDSGLQHGGEPVTRLELLADDDEGGPTKLSFGDLVFYPVRRGDRVGVRVKDRQSAIRTGFEGIDSFPIDPSWRIAARFEAYDPPKQIPVANIVGIVEDTASWGAVVFERDGSSHRLDVLAEPGDEELFIIFADQTSGKETYGAGRYLYAGAPSADGAVVVDFNRAYNPPCVFTAYATCPLPPPQNRLGVRVEAGEKTWQAGGH